MVSSLEGWAQKARVAELMEKLLANGNWCGETHVQKCTYFLEDLYNVPVGFEFVLYKLGPYSFDLHDALAEMKANDVIKAIPQQPYGASLRLSERAGLLSNLRRADACYAIEVDQIAQQFGKAMASELERLSTAVFITKHRDVPPEKRATILNRLKPHIRLADAAEAVRQVDALLAGSRSAS